MEETLYSWYVTFAYGLPHYGEFTEIRATSLNAAREMADKAFGGQWSYIYDKRDDAITDPKMRELPFPYDLVASRVVNELIVQRDATQAAFFRESQANDARIAAETALRAARDEFATRIQDATETARTLQNLLNAKAGKGPAPVAASEPTYPTLDGITVKPASKAQ